MADHYHFVTGRIAEHALRDVLGQLRAELDFDCSVGVLPITVAALMTPAWIARRIKLPPNTTHVVVPGYCNGDLEVIREAAAQQAPAVEVKRGPKDLRQLPEFFGRPATPSDFGQFDIEIVAEINHAPRMTLAAILAEAGRLADDGADVIDIGCEPGSAWPRVAESVRALRDAGHRVSIDSLNPLEIAPAVAAGAELVLSVQSGNRHAAPDWNCEVVAIPDEPSNLASLDETVDFLASRSVPLRIDPILEPIGCGFAASLGRYLETRRRYPDAEMLMGIGNLTELTDVDSAAVNVLLLGFCQETEIRSVLTTQVINWARSSVKECDFARRLVYHAVAQVRPPKNITQELLLLRDAKCSAYGDAGLEKIAQQVKDHNYRIFEENGQLHLLFAGQHLKATDPFQLLADLLATDPPNLDASHAFYLGYELCKATTAATLGKQYEQDEALDWGFLTIDEPKRGGRKSR